MSFLGDSWNSGALCALLTLPVAEPQGWQLLKFDRIPANEVRHTAAGLELEVRKSAGPLVHVLREPARVTRLEVRGRFTGSLRVPPDKHWTKGFDDALLRVGLVEPGGRALTFVERRTAPEWLRKMDDVLGPKGGVRRIHSFNLATEAQQVGRVRVHPASDLFLERIVAAPQPDGRFWIAHDLPSPLLTTALWLHADGDDTGSSFRVVVEQVQLTIAETAKPETRRSP